MQKAVKLLTAIFLLATLTGFKFLNSGPDSDQDPFWAQSVETDTTTIDHQLWQQVLDDYLVVSPDGVNKVDYEGIQLESDSALDQYIKYLSGFDPRSLRAAEQMSFWINLYNALTVQLVAKHYPVESIREIGGSLLSRGPWDDEAIVLAGKSLTLNDIEHRILRPNFRDYRIHFAVNCASIGCPNLMPMVFSPENMEDILQRATKDFLKHPRGIRIENSVAVLSSIFQWYQEDFGEDESEMLSTLAKYLDSPAILLSINTSDIEYEYDWRVNGLD